MTTLIKLNRVVILIMFLSSGVRGQSIYSVDLSHAATPILRGHLKLGTHQNANGDILDANSLYFTKNGQPWYPVMGEIHFSRYPREKWEEAILKMKAAGIDVIASYVFWIYHEEEEGHYNWTEDNDLRAFAELCKKHQVFFFARIGPWCHGEVRNGGFPDWIVKKGNTRKNNPEYLRAVQRFYNEIGKQLSGLYFKDGGPVIGTQIENEYRFNNPAGLEHMLTLKQMAIQAGIDVPYYTATGWPGSNQEQNELLPVWGAYSEAPWDKKTTKLALSENYIFTPLRGDATIGSDLLGKHEADSNYTGYRYPYATAEMGGGNQITYHRRPIIQADDVTALSYVKVGSGANLMGYYMFHGGANPIGKLSTLQESKATKYPNDYPIISYDFQAPIGEWGQVRPSYRSYKVIHSFLNDFGNQLVQYTTSFPDQKPSGPGDNSLLRFVVRSKESSGFVFISNYQRQLTMKDFEGVQFNLKFHDTALSFPKKPITVKKDLQVIFPFNIDLGVANLKYATAQPLCILKGTIPMYVFFAPDGIDPEYVFDKTSVTEIKATDAIVLNSASEYQISDIKPGTASVIAVSLRNGKRINVLTLSHKQALDTWKGNAFGEERLFKSEQELTFPGNDLRIQSVDNPHISFSVYPKINKLIAGKHKLNESMDGIFKRYTFNLRASKLEVSVREVKDINSYQNKGKLEPFDDRDTGQGLLVKPGQQYQTNLLAVTGSRYYAITIPAALGDLNEAYMKINYTGDTGSLYLNGILIADDFYSGSAMTVGLKRIFETGGIKKLLLQIVPWANEREVFFEEGIREVIKSNSASLSDVSITHQYEVVVSGK